MNGSLPTTSGFTFNGTVRRYYVAAEEVEWDYAPTGWDNWLGVSWTVLLRTILRTNNITTGTFQ